MGCKLEAAEEHERIFRTRCRAKPPALSATTTPQISCSIVDFRSRLRISARLGTNRARLRIRTASTNNNPLDRAGDVGGRQMQLLRPRQFLATFLQTRALNETMCALPVALKTLFSSRKTPPTYRHVFALQAWASLERHDWRICDLQTNPRYRLVCTVSLHIPVKLQYLIWRQESV
jgi:hypothetical protein